MITKLLLTILLLAALFGITICDRYAYSGYSNRLRYPIYQYGLPRSGTVEGGV